MKRTIAMLFGVVLAAGCQTQSSDSAGTSSDSAPDPISTPATRIGGLELNPLELHPSAPTAAPISPPAMTPAAAPASPPAAASQATAPPPVSAPAAAPIAQENPPPSTERVKADVGVGKRGQSLEQHSGVLVEPAKAYFRFEQKAVFQIQLPQALELFKATEGRLPSSHDEFMSRIVQANNIQLPTLRPGEKYIYVPEKGELMVERPAK
jgi:hypothetical protein